LLITAFGLFASEAGYRRLSALGGLLPVIVYSRLLAHGYDITTPLAMINTSGNATQIPITLCQFHSLSPQALAGTAACSLRSLHSTPSAATDKFLISA
jgi:hypothetical protein